MAANGTTAATENGSAAGNVFETFHEVNGMKLSWTQQLKTIDQLKTFEVRDDDVFVITYPKSGELLFSVLQCRWVWVIEKPFTNLFSFLKNHGNRRKKTIYCSEC